MQYLPSFIKFGPLVQKLLKWMHSSIRKCGCTFTVCGKDVCAYSPKNSVSPVDLHWLLYSTRSKRVNIPQEFSSQQAIGISICYRRAEYQHVTVGRNVNVLLHGISTCYWRAECQCYWREEYQYVTGGRNINMLLEGGMSTCY